MRNYLHDAHVTEWIRHGVASPLPVSTSVVLADFLNGLPWFESTVLLDKLGHEVVLDLSGRSASEVRAWAMQTSVASHRCLVALYSPKVPSLALDRDFA